MKKGIKIFITTCLFILLVINIALSQISPGDLAEVHAHLEGISNCTKCHELGKQVTNEKCLDCHKPLKTRIDLNKGYHSSTEVANVACVKCHNDHHGRKFQIIRFEPDTFNHQLAGYELLGKHKGINCIDCHKKEFITDKQIRDKKYTYLGLNTECLTCHEDYHQNTLSASCSECHNFELFKPAVNFNHNNTDYPLLGKHSNLECEKCHKIITRNGERFQEFSGIQYNNCTSCHTDVHNNQFGQNCTQCHTVESFHVIKELNNFNHNKTRYPLEGKHQMVECKSCHKTRYTDPLAFNRCTNCHEDYHENQFRRGDDSPDCSDCHSVSGFAGSSFTVQRHEKSSFPLEGAHLATPCFACHKKTDKWSFRNIGERCVDCHEDIHDEIIDKKYYPDANCESCHEVSLWRKINFDHSITEFELLGAHKQQSCRSCHFIPGTGGSVNQQFNGLSTACTNCHTDIHYGQFDVEGISDCLRCHEFENWNAEKFDHNNTDFPLDGKHKDVSCEKCHKEMKQNEYIYVQYEITDHRCEACH